MYKIKILFVFSWLLVLVACSDETNDKKSATENIEVKPTTVDAVVIRPTSSDHIDTVKKSLKAVATGSFGETNLKIEYHSPAVRSRVIWGGLVPYDQVWVTGAHRATSLETDNEIVIGGEKIPAGKYALFSIPGKEEWIVIINKKWDQHLADEYDEKDDWVRLAVKPEMMNTFQERLMYQVKADNYFNVFIEVSWEKIKLVIPVQVLKK